jgi:hypothetical protein
MTLGLRYNAAFVGASILILRCCICSFADESGPSHQVTLADLAAYHTALSGKPTADDAGVSDPPAQVSFKDLWNRPLAFRGRRVTIQGRVERIFRQGPVGSFPALAEVWITSPAGNPFCLVVPQDGRTGVDPVKKTGLEGYATSPVMPEPGQTVRFTGTFLKMVRFAAGDGARLAPLVVGNQPPVLAQETIKARSAISRRSDDDSSDGSHPDNHIERSLTAPLSWALAMILAALAAGVLAWQHLRAPLRHAGVSSLGGRTAAADPDPPPEFIEPRDEPLPST